MWPIICTYLYILAGIVFYIDIHEGEADDSWHWVVPVVFWPIFMPIFLIWYAVCNPEE